MDCLLNENLIFCSHTAKKCVNDSLSISYADLLTCFLVVLGTILYNNATQKKNLGAFERKSPQNFSSNNSASTIKDF